MNGRIIGAKVRTQLPLLVASILGRKSSYDILLFLFEIDTGKGTLYHSDGSIFKGQFVGDEKVEGVVHLEDGILRRERYVNGILQQD